MQRHPPQNSDPYRIRASVLDIMDIQASRRHFSQGFGCLP